MDVDGRYLRNMSTRGYELRWMVHPIPSPHCILDSATPCSLKPLILFVQYHIPCSARCKGVESMISEQDRRNWRCVEVLHLQLQNPTLPLHRHSGRESPHRTRRLPSLNDLPLRGQHQCCHLVYRALLRLEHVHHLTSNHKAVR